MRLAVIGTFYRRHDRNREIIDALIGQTRRADEHWILCETDEDARAFASAYLDGDGLPCLRLVTLPTPRDQGTYAVIPYSYKINWALDRTDADAIVYLDNGSTPHPEKFEVMTDALKDRPVVYCGQHRTGIDDLELRADRVVHNAFGYLNYTQVMHRPTKDRWPLEMDLAIPTDLADAVFWRRLHESLGAFFPAGENILDTHHIESRKAAGL